jgi:hypothetical protein
MAHVYEKFTKDMVDLPSYVLCFLGIIMDKLEFYGLIEGKPGKSETSSPSVLVVPIVSRKFQYCYDAIELIEKTMKRRGFDCKMEHYKTIEMDGKDGNKEKGYSYEYKLSKSKK